MALGKLGYNNCNCNIIASYKITSTYHGNTGFFAYTGSTNIDSLVWSWGDGSRSVYTSNFAATVSHVYAGPGSYQVCVSAYNDTCNDHQYCDSLPLGIANTLAGEVKVYPNPATRQLYVEGLAGGSARIVSVTGQCLLRAAIGEQKQALSIGHLPAGYYNILLQDAT